jgi:hypothetical protein
MLRYDIRTGVKNIKTKTVIAVSAVTLGVSGLGMAVAVPALSHAAGKPTALPSQASTCGTDHGAFADVNGSFGSVVGHGGTPVYHDGAVGQDSGATGYNNSHTDCQG